MNAHSRDFQIIRNQGLHINWSRCFHLDDHLLLCFLIVRQSDIVANNPPLKDVARALASRELPTMGGFLLHRRLDDKENKVQQLYSESFSHLTDDTGEEQEVVERADRLLIVAAWLMNRRHIYVWCEYQRSHHILVYLWLKKCSFNRICLSRL